MGVWGPRLASRAHPAPFNPIRGSLPLIHMDPQYVTSPNPSCGADTGIAKSADHTAYSSERTLVASPDIIPEYGCPLPPSRASASIEPDPSWSGLNMAGSMASPSAEATAGRSMAPGASGSAVMPPPGPCMAPSSSIAAVGHESHDNDLCTPGAMAPKGTGSLPAPLSSSSETDEHGGDDPPALQADSEVDEDIRATAFRAPSSAAQSALRTPALRPPPRNIAPARRTAVAAAEAARVAGQAATAGARRGHPAHIGGFSQRRDGRHSAGSSSSDRPPRLVDDSDGSSCGGSEGPPDLVDSSGDDSSVGPPDLVDSSDDDDDDGPPPLAMASSSDEFDDDDGPPDLVASSDDDDDGGGGGFRARLQRASQRVSMTQPTIQ